MRLHLKRHPDFTCEAVTSIEVELARPSPGVLHLCYFVSGAVGDLRLPTATVPARADNLWKHTCFEAFVRAAGQGAYREINLAPSGEWAAYRFDGYRSDMGNAEVHEPRIQTSSSEDCFGLDAAVELDLASDLPWQLGLSAVIEEANGCKSYWALSHPAGKPDFHHPDSFTLEISAPA